MMSCFMRNIFYGFILMEYMGKNIGKSQGFVQFLTFQGLNSILKVEPNDKTCNFYDNNETSHIFPTDAHFETIVCSDVIKPEGLR